MLRARSSSRTRCPARCDSAGAENDDARLVTRRRGLVVLSPGRVEVVRGRLDLARARVDSPEHGPDASLVTESPYLGAAQPADLAERVVPPAGPLRPRHIATRELGARRISARNQGMQPFGQILVVEARPRRGRAALEFARPMRLQQRLRERPADAHRLSHRLHLGAERLVGAGELLEREARELDDDVVERRLEARGRRLREVVRDLVERVPDGELGRDLRDRVPRRLGGERGGARHARVHLDDAQLARGAAARELDVGAAGLDADGADDRCRCVAKLLVGLVGECHLRRNRHRVARVHAHRVEVLDRADDHDVVRAVAHDLELELVPAAHGLLDEHLPDRRLRGRARPGTRASRDRRRSRRRAPRG